MEAWLDPVYDAAGMGAADRWAIEEAGVPSLELMEAAGRGLARVAADLSTTEGGNEGLITVVCGKGNNGGDGLVAARHLDEAGFEVSVILLAGRDQLSPDSQANFDRLPEGLAEIHEVSLQAGSLRGVIIDALLGTGFDGEPRGPVADAIDAIGQPGEESVELRRAANARLVEASDEW